MLAQVIIPIVYSSFCIFITCGIGVCVYYKKLCFLPEDDNTYEEPQEDYL